MEITDQEQQRPLSTYSIDELIMLTEQYDGELQRRQVTMATIYIAANLSRQGILIISCIIIICV